MINRSVSLMLSVIMLVAVFTVIPASAAENDEATSAAAAETVQTAKTVQTATEPAQTGATETATQPDDNFIEFVNGRIAFEINDSQVTITSAEKISGRFSIPGTVKGYPVTAVGSNAFKDQTGMTSLTLPSTLKSISAGAFLNCSSLNSLTVPSSVTEIGSAAFAGCDGIGSVILGKNVTVIGERAFGYTSSMDKRSGFTVVGYFDTAAESYAVENGISFVDILSDTYPHITGFENTDKGTLIKWNAYKNAYAYRVYYRNGQDWVRLAQVTGTSYTDTTVKSDRKRVYTIRCVNKAEDFVSDYYTRGWSNIYFAPPVIKSIENTVSGVRLSWNRAENAQDYRVYRSTAGSSWTRLTQTSASSYTDTTAKSGVRYYYTLRMITSDGADYMSDYNSGRAITFVAAPVIKSIENTDNGAKLSWDKVPGADFYRIYYKTPSGDWTRLASKYLTEYTDTSVKGGQTRIYTIRCLNEREDFVSDYNGDGWSNTYVSTPVISSLENVYGGIEIKWNKCAGAEKYRVYYMNAKGDWVNMVETDSTSYIDTDVVSGYHFTYTVRCISSDGTRFMSDHKGGKKIRYVAAPKITSLENTEYGLKISWTKSAGADFYRIYYKTSSGDWTRLASKYLTEYYDTTVKDGQTRIYTIRCLNENEDFVSGFNENGWKQTFYAAPEIVSVSSSGGNNVVKWNAVKGAASYRLYRRELNGSWVRIVDSTTATSYTDKSVKKGKIYAYTLRLMDKDENFISDYIGHTRHYLNGSKLDGNIFYDGTYGFKDGYQLFGLNRVGGLLRYYNSEGRMYRDYIANTSSGYYYIDPDGICIESQEMRLAAEFMDKYCKGDTLKAKMKYAFMYMAKNFPYRRIYGVPAKESDVVPLAIDMFKQRSGNCFSYASAFACIAKIAGYRARVGIGTTDGLPHGWTEVYVNGRWLICDIDANIPHYHVPDYNAYMMTYHYWQLTKRFSSEAVFSNGTTKWL